MIPMISLARTRVQGKPDVPKEASHVVTSQGGHKDRLETHAFSALHRISFATYPTNPGVLPNLET